MEQVIITLHAYERAKDRLGLDKNQVNKIATKAFYQGMTHKQSSGKLKKYLDKLWLNYRRCNNVRIYKDNVFLFSNTTLVTIYPLPNNHKTK